MAVNPPYCRMGETCVNRDVASKRFEDVQYLGKFEIFFSAMGEPTPILPRRVFLDGNPNSIRVIYAYKSTGSLVCGLIFRAKGFEPRQS
jgi:hypothetical protein